MIASRDAAKFMPVAFAVMLIGIADPFRLGTGWLFDVGVLMLNATVFMMIFTSHRENRKRTAPGPPAEGLPEDIREQLRFAEAVLKDTRRMAWTWIVFVTFQVALFGSIAHFGDAATWPEGLIWSSAVLVGCYMLGMTLVRYGEVRQAYDSLVVFANARERARKEGRS